MNRVSLFLLVSALLIVSTLAAPNVINQDVVSGRCYQYINTTVTSWDQAKAAADASSFNGVPGYLVTVTTQAEQDYIITNVISNTSALVYTAGITNTVGDYVWADGPENGQTIVNSSSVCQQAVCFFRAGFPTSFLVNNTIQYSFNEWINGPLVDVAGFIVEYGNATNPCVQSISTTPSAQPSNSFAATASNTAAPAASFITTGLSISPSNNRPTITITSTISTTSVSRTTGKRATTGSRTTGKRATTGKISAASSMTFSAVSVFVAGVTLLFLRR